MKRWAIRLFAAVVLVINVWLVYRISTISSIPSVKQVDAYIQMLDKACNGLAKDSQRHFETCNGFDNHKKESEEIALAKMRQLLFFQDSALEIVSRIRSLASERWKAEEAFQQYVQLIQRNKILLESGEKHDNSYLNKIAFKNGELVGHALLVNTEQIIRLKSAFLQEIVVTNINSHLNHACSYCIIDTYY
jgi:hypothetical protein